MVECYYIFPSREVILLIRSLFHCWMGGLTRWVLLYQSSVHQYCLWWQYFPRYTLYRNCSFIAMLILLSVIYSTKDFNYFMCLFPLINVIATLLLTFITVTFSLTSADINWDFKTQGAPKTSFFYAFSFVFLHFFASLRIKSDTNLSMTVLIPQRNWIRFINHLWDKDEFLKDQNAKILKAIIVYQ